MIAGIQVIRPNSGRFRGLIVLLCAMLLVLVAGCEGDPEKKPALNWHPPLLPIEISVRADGRVEVHASPQIATPVGTFSVEQSLGHRDVANDETLLVIRRAVQGIQRDTLIRIKKSVKMTFLLDGSYDLKSESNVAVLKLRRGVSGIRIQDDQGRKDAGRFSAKQVPTLPDPTATATPTGTATPTETPSCNAAEQPECAGTPVPVPTEAVTPEPTVTSEPTVAAEPAA